MNSYTIAIYMQHGFAVRNIRQLIIDISGLKINGIMLQKVNSQSHVTIFFNAYRMAEMFLPNFLRVSLIPYCDLA